MLDTEVLFSGSEKRASSQARHKRTSFQARAQRAFSQVRHRGPPLMDWHRGPPLGLGSVGLLSVLAERASSQSWPLKHSGSTLGLLSDSTQRASSQTRHRGPPLRLCTGLSSRTQQRGPPFMLCTEGLLLCSAQRTSLRARHRGPPLRLSREGLLNHFNPKSIMRPTVCTYVRRAHDILFCR